jgi:hypothetical protein
LNRSNFDQIFFFHVSGGGTTKVFLHATSKTASPAFALNSIQYGIATDRFSSHKAIAKSSSITRGRHNGIESFGVLHDQYSDTADVEGTATNSNGIGGNDVC